MPLLDPSWLSLNATIHTISHPNIFYCDPIWSWKVESLTEYEIWCTLDGHGEIKVNEQNYPLVPGSSLLLRPHDRVEANHHPPQPLKVFSYKFELQDHRGETILNPAIDFPRGMVYIKERSRLEAAVILAMDWNADTKDRQRIRESAIWQILLMIDDSSHRPWGQNFDERIFEAVQAMHDDLAHKWSVSDLAEFAGMSRSNFQKLFVELLGESPIRYLIHQRFEKAKRLMAHTSLSLKRIASQLGYSDLYSFKQQFAKINGVTPDSVRRSSSL